MKTKIVLFCFLFSLQSVTLIAQTFTLYGDKTFGGNLSEANVLLTLSGTNQFILTGNTNTNVNGDKTDPLCSPTSNNQEDIWLLKIDTTFNIIWNKDIGGDNSDQIPNLISTNYNNQMIFACRSYSDSSCQKSEHNRDTNLLSSDYWICMLDSNGNKLWDKTLGGIGPDVYPRIIELTSGDFIVCGGSNSLVGGDKTVANYGQTDYWAIKLDSMGNKLWDKVYGGTGNEIAIGSVNASQFALLADKNGGFLLGGTTNSPISGNITQVGQGSGDVWIIKLDSGGNQLWDRRYGGSAYDRFANIIGTNDNGYILLATTQSPQGGDVSDTSRGGTTDVWIIKLDSLGNKQWDKRYGGNSADEGNWILPALGEGYWVSGSTQSGASGEVSEASYGITDYWVFKIDGVGNKLWDKRFGAAGIDVGSNFIIMPDSSIYLFGYADSGTSAVKTDAGKGQADYWLVHFKYVDPVIIGSGVVAAGTWQLATSPNPASSICTITLNSTSTLQHHNTLTLYDITGRALLQQPFSVKANLDVSGISKGVYIVEVRDKEGRIVKGKLVKE